MTGGPDLTQVYLSRCLCAWGFGGLILALVGLAFGILSIVLGELAVSLVTTAVRKAMAERFVGETGTTTSVLLYLVSSGPYVLALLMLAFTTVMTIAQTVPFFVAAGCVRRARPSLRVWAVVVALMCGFVFPLGTALAVWTLYAAFLHEPRTVGELRRGLAAG